MQVHYFVGQNKATSRSASPLIGCTWQTHDRLHLSERTKRAGFTQNQAITRLLMSRQLRRPRLQDFLFVDLRSLWEQMFASKHYFWLRLPTFDASKSFNTLLNPKNFMPRAPQTSLQRKMTRLLHKFLQHPLIAQNKISRPFLSPLWKVFMQ